MGGRGGGSKSKRGAGGGTARKESMIDSIKRTSSATVEASSVSDAIKKFNEESSKADEFGFGWKMSKSGSSYKIVETFNGRTSPASNVIKNVAIENVGNGSYRIYQW